MARYPRSPILKVNVSDELIAKGEVKNSGFCAVAEAVKIAFKKATGREAKHVSADLQSIRLTDIEKRLRYMWLSPGAAAVIVINNDQAIHSEAVSFTLRGAHVMRMANAPRRKKGETKPPYKMPPPKKAILRGSKLKTAPRGTMTVPERVGGKEPPQFSLAGGDLPEKQPKKFGVAQQIANSRRREWGRRLLKAGPKLQGAAP